MSNPIQHMRRWKRGAYARRSDPETSHEAARALGPAVLNERQAHVGLAITLLGGRATDSQIADIYDGMDAPWQSPSSLRTRRNELVKLGVVRDSGERGTTRSGNRTIVWELTNERELELRGEEA